MRFKLLITSLLICYEASAIDCNLMKYLTHPALSDKVQFWEDYGKLSHSGKLSDRTLGDLLKKYGVEAKAEVPVQPKIIREPINYSTARKADKDISTLSPGLRKNYEEFMTLMSDKSGIKELYANPGRWHMEKIKRFNDVYSVRLNGGVRVLFKLEKNDLTVMEVNAAKVHDI